jgi:hypothetical protein
LFVVQNVISLFITLKKYKQRVKNGIKHVFNVVRSRSSARPFFSFNWFRLYNLVSWLFIKSSNSFFFSLGKTGLCKKMLESTTLAEHQGNVFCKQCYARKFVSDRSIFTFKKNEEFRTYRVQKV